MSQDHKRVKKIIDEIEKTKSIEAYGKQLSPLSEKDILALDQSGFSGSSTAKGLQERIDFLENKNISVDYITGKKQFNEPESLKGNIENYIGMAQVPIGLAGPLLINGLHASGDFFVPLATTEGAMVASYNRGMKACRLSGGITSVCLVEGVQRSPFFKFENIATIGLFIRWIHEHMDVFASIVSEASRYASLNDLKTHVEGNSIILAFEYSTGDASGQNMVTICTDKICQYILENFEPKPKDWYIESNFSGDKKATSLSFSTVRGKKVIAEAVVFRNVVEKILRTTPEKIANYWQSSTLAVTQSGSIGAQGHIANGLTAVFIACGQDVACVSESSVGITRMEINSEGNLYLSVTLPSLIVGTIGGGTTLPTQKECLQMLNCVGEGKAKKFAEICCATALAGELSIASALAANHFAKAHQILGRKK